MYQSGQTYLMRALLRHALLTGVLLCMALTATAGEAMPLIGEITKKTKDAGKEGAPGQSPEETPSEEPAFPQPLQVEQTRMETGELLPAGPFLYLEVPQGKTALEAAEQTALASLLQEEQFNVFFHDNPLTLENLFTDLPQAYSNPRAVELFQAGGRMIQAFTRQSGTIALALYGGASSSGNAPAGLSAVFLAQIGFDRRPAHEKLQSTLEAFLQDSPNFLRETASHKNDYIDILRSPDRKAALAYGIIRNYVIVSSNVEMAQALMRYAEDPKAEGRLASSQVYRNVPARVDAQSQLRGFVHLPALLHEVSRSQLPGAREVVDFSCDIAGRGVVYYDLRADGKRVIEHVVSPTDIQGAEVFGIPRRLRDICVPATKKQEWSTARLVPYRPNTFFAAQVRPAAFMTLLQANAPFGGSDFALNLALFIPDPMKSIVATELGRFAEDLFEGEVALALLEKKEDRREWIIILAVKKPSRVQAMLGRGRRDPVIKSGAVDIFSDAEDDEWETSPSWAVFDAKLFQALGGQSHLVLASSGNLLQTLVDQTTAGAANLASNKDYQTSLQALGKNQSVICYYNLREIALQWRRDLNEIVRSYFPRIKSVTNRPNSETLRKHLFGIAAGVHIRPDEPYIQTTVIGPAPVAPWMTGGLTLNLPRWIRERARVYLSQSRGNLGKLWLELQTYATQRGHYPETMDELRRLFPKPVADRIFVSQAAVDQLGSIQEAKHRTYAYLAGLRTTDEPDLPIIYETRPWHYEYVGMLRPQMGRPAETGRYERWRLVLQKDGTIHAYTEDEFVKSILPRIKARQ